MKKIIFLTIFIFSLQFLLLAQTQIEKLKIEAIKEMKVNRLGDAIDLLNRYIAAKPRNIDGYLLRGQCYERRKQYEYAVYDYRSARKIDPNNKEIINSLKRAEESWQKLIFNKIEGHKREIAINTQKAVNYLEIGKSYKNIGQWREAEEWYDEYLKKEEASPDEIIRYTEILSKNNHIAKGLPILKRYTEKYPKDHRVWSRYGYFALWLGKTQIAIKAFENALEFRPFFKEAMDGLDQAKGKGYIYMYNDTTSTGNTYYMTKGGKGTSKRTKKPQEFAIDRYSKILFKNPADDDTRIKLVEELYKNERYEEAIQHLDTLKIKNQDNEKVTSLFSIVSQKRDSLLLIKISALSIKVNTDKNDKESIQRLAEYYSRTDNYDSAIVILSNYLYSKSENEDLDVRYQLARYLTWNYQFEDAIDQLKVLLNIQPENLDYQMLRAQIAVWNSLDLDLAEGYLNNVLVKDPNNFKALIAMSSLKIRKSEFIEAKSYLDRARSVDPNNKELETIENYYNGSLANAEQLKIYEILFEAREIALTGDCIKATIKYEEYLSKTASPTRLELAEYADYVACTKDYKKSIDIYNKLLEEEYDFDVAVARAKTYLMMGDRATALIELTKLVNENPEDYHANLNLATAYEYHFEYDSARVTYNRMLQTIDDTAKVAIIKQRIGWLEKADYQVGLFGSFGFSPFFNMYRDNQRFTLQNYGGRVETSLTSFLGFGISAAQLSLRNRIETIRANIYKGQLFSRIGKYVSAAVSVGVAQIKNEENETIYDALIKYDNKNNLVISGYFEGNVAKLMLYSPNLLDQDFRSNLLRISSSYKNKSGFIIKGYFTNIWISDENTGSDFQLRIGKQFLDELSAGYEYYFMNYSEVSPFYYSPQNFESHSVWLDWIAEKTDQLTITIGGKLGIIPNGNLGVREITGEVTYQPFINLVLNGKLGIGSTYRDQDSYNSISGSITAYWAF